MYSIYSSNCCNAMSMETQLVVSGIYAAILWGIEIAAVFGT